MPTILAAMDKFKDSMTAEEACAAAAEGAREALSDAEILKRPLTDGGEGFCRILTEQAGGELVTVQVTGPLREPVDALYGTAELSNLPEAVREQFDLPDTGRVAIIEMAQASGLEKVPAGQRNPLKTTTRGTGELIRRAADQGVAAIVLGIGGSATNDLGLGALEPLGLRFEDRNGQVLDPVVPADWLGLFQIEGEMIRVPPLRIACDVDNPLHGARGAAAVYGPQKGLRSEDLPRVQEQMQRLSRQLRAYFGVPAEKETEPGAGAAGGIGFGLAVACGARFVPGFDLVAAWLDLWPAMEKADIVITGEGRFDRSSLSGKGPGEVARRALNEKRRTLLLAGSLEAGVDEDLDGRDLLTARSITPAGMELDEALKRGAENLRHTVAEILSEG